MEDDDDYDYAANSNDADEALTADWQWFRV